MPFLSIEKAIEEVGAGRMVIVVDDKDRENEGDLVMDGIQGSSVLTRS